MPVYSLIYDSRGPNRFKDTARFKPLPEYQVAVSHFHTHFNEMLSDAGSIDVQPPWVTVFRSLGINIAMMSDFYGDGHPNDPGPLRFKEQQVYFDGCRRHSDREFLIMPLDRQLHKAGEAAGVRRGLDSYPTVAVRRQLPRY